MKDKLFDSEIKIKAAISDLTNLQSQAGWKLLEEILDANIEAVTELILDGKNLSGESATEDETNRLRDKLKVYREVKDTPNRVIKRFTSPEIDEPSMDPYQTIEQLKEERKRSN